MLDNSSHTHTNWIEKIDTILLVSKNRERDRDGVECVGLEC